MGTTGDSTITLNTLWLRRLIGFTGFGLPVVMVVSGWAFDVDLQSSLSSYYHTKVNVVFIFLFIAVGVLVCAYRGYNSVERSAGVVVLVTSAMIALFPPGESVWLDDAAWPANSTSVLGNIHFVGTILFFPCILVFRVEFRGTQRGA